MLQRSNTATASSALWLQRASKLFLGAAAVDVPHTNFLASSLSALNRPPSSPPPDTAANSSVGEPGSILLPTFRLMNSQYALTSAWVCLCTVAPAPPFPPADAGS